jgi:hypothetical protein
MKVQFVAFHTPQADSLAQSCDITSRRASGRFRSSFRTEEGAGRVGVLDRDLLSSSRLLWLCFRGLRERETAGLLASSRGVVEVKYPGESSSESSSEGG